MNTDVKAVTAGTKIAVAVTRLNVTINVHVVRPVAASITRG